MGVVVGKLRLGDVLLKESEIFRHFKLSHLAIRFGQLLGGTNGGDHTSVHAAIYIGGGLMAESKVAGLGRNSLFESRDWKWKAFRYVHNAEIAECAADVADNLARREDGLGDFGKYDHKSLPKTVFESGRITSPARRAAVHGKTTTALDDMWKPDGPRRFFCSNYVAFCYAVASEALSNNPHYAIDLDYERATPAQMEGFMRQSKGKWVELGNVLF
jgi:hypothetical protein